MTIKQRLIKAILERGGKKANYPHACRYDVYTLPTIPDKFIFLGSRGACRIGRTVSTSHDSRRVKLALLRWIV